MSTRRCYQLGRPRWGRTKRGGQPYAVQALRALVDRGCGGARGRSGTASWWATVLAALIAGGLRGSAAQPGDILWDFATADEVLECPAIGADGTVYVRTAGNEVFALDGGTGRQQWVTPADSSCGGLAIGLDGTLYLPGLIAGPTCATVCAVEPVTGGSPWCVSTGSPYWPEMAIGADNTLYVGRYALDGFTGAQGWSLGGDSNSQAVGADGTVYVAVWAIEGPALYAYTAATGGTKWSLQAGSGRRYMALSVGTNRRVFAIFHEQWPDRDDTYTLQALDAATGVLRWQRLLSYGTDASPCIDSEGTVYLMIGGQVYALKGTDGAERWRFVPDLPSPSRCDGYPDYAATPALGGDGTLYARDRRTLWALDSITGKKQWEFTLPDGCLNSQIALGLEGTVYVAASEVRGDRWTGRLYALHGTAPLAQAPWAKWRADAQNTGRASAPPLRLTIYRYDERARIEWTGEGVLQFSDTLGPGVWEDAKSATSPYDVELANAQRFYRLRRPRRGRRESGSQQNALQTLARGSGAVGEVAK